jgi:hypothetical protein
MDEIDLKRFDMSKIKPDSVCCFVAPRRQGKSILIRDLLSHHQNIPAGLVFSQTDKLTHFYDSFIPPVLIHDEYDPKLMDSLFERQKKALEEAWPNPYCFLIMDDVLSSADQWKKDKNIKEIFYNGRHYKILFLLTMQTTLGITPGLRANIDYTFILRNTNNKMRRDLYENYAGMFPTREIFERVLDVTTENYGCLVIDNTTRSSRLEDQIFHYRANINIPPFKLCSNSFWTRTKKTKNVKDSDSTTTTTSKGKRLVIRKM